MRELGILLGLRQTVGSSDAPLPFCLKDCLYATCQLHQYDSTAYFAYVEQQLHPEKPQPYPRPKPPSLLTVAGKALTKHAHRDTSASFWGLATGPRKRGMIVNNARSHERPS